MKTWKNVTLERMVNLDRAKQAWFNASKGKRNKPNVQRYNDTSKLLKLVEDIYNDMYEPITPYFKQIKDKGTGKIRQIHCPAFRDQLVHWMIMLSLREHFENNFIQHAVANIPGKGTEYGRKLIKHWVSRRKKETKWALQLDIEKYYASIDIDILMNKLKRRIRDDRVIALIEKNLRVVENGLTLGSYFNQWAAIFYLSDLDHLIKEQLRCKFYLRYVDDLLLLFPSKKKALFALSFIKKELSELKLKVKTNGSGCIRLFKVKDKFIDMLGYRTYRNGTQTLRRRNYLSLVRLCNKILNNGVSRRQSLALLSKRGQLVHSNCRFLRRAVDGIIQTYKLKYIAYA